MFGFLSKDKKRGKQFTHHVYLNRAGKFRMMVEDINSVSSVERKALLVYYFEETRIIIEQLLNAAGLPYSSANTPDNKVLLVKADQLVSILSNPKNTCVQAFISEIYPISGKDDLMLETIQHYLPNVSVAFYTSLDSPIMKLFGGDKNQNLMLQMGLSENEKIEHAMVTKSILRAQKKIKEKVQFEKPANSKQEWIELNVQ